MDLSELIAGLGVQPIGGAAPRGIEISDITEDSRRVVPGSLFIARAGAKEDGKAFVRDAVRGGAAAILCDGVVEPAADGGVAMLVADHVPLATARLAERFFGNPSSNLTTVLVTGTNGKTTTASLAWQLMNGAGRRCGLVGTVRVDDGGEVRPAAMTTPPAIELSRVLARMVRHGCVAASIEASSHALHQRRLDGLRVRVGVFTNLTGDHLDYHTTMEHYAASKARLFELVDAGGRAIVNADDPAWERMVRRCRAPLWRCSMERDAECRVEVLGATMGSTSLRLVGAWGRIEAEVPLIGAYNAMNVLQAVSAAHAAGLEREALSVGLARVCAPPGRLERVAGGDGSIEVFVDYAHSDDSLRSVLGAAREALTRGAGRGDARGRLWVVFGCGGERDRTKRPRMGAAAALADRVVVTSDNPRSERPGAIIDEILSGMPAAARAAAHIEPDRERAIRVAIAEAEPGDVVVIAGKGHETEQVLTGADGGTHRVHFDDREIAAAELEERSRRAPAGHARAATSSRPHAAHTSP